MLGCLFFCKSQVKQGKVYCQILAKVGNIAMATGLVKDKAYKKILEFIRLFHHLPVVNSDKSPSVNTVLIKF